MLTRQKLLLSIIQHARSPLTRILLFKYAFLLSKESNLPHGMAFYDFVPFKYGPYSFALARELQILEHYGYINRDADFLRLCPGMEDATKDILRQLPLDLGYQVSSLVGKYSKSSQTEVLQQVYHTYPTFTFRSQLRELVPSSAAEPATAPLKIYTLGYEGKSVDGFFNLIVQRGLKSIIDVRANPISRKYGFAKKTLSAIAEKLKIQYFHISGLGIPSDKRRGLGTTLSHTELFDDYEFRVLPDCSAYRKEAIDVISAQPSVLVCMEEDAGFCHRSRLAKRLAMESGFAVQNL
jgi:uncharacterized protein (DUF488 family)